MPSEVIARLLVQLEAAQRLADEGKWEEATEAFSRGPGDPQDATHERPFHRWPDAFRQECLEQQTPAPDPRQYVLDRLKRYAEGRDYTAQRGMPPRDLLHRWGVFDERLTGEQIRLAAEALVAEGALVYREQKFWLPDDWRALVEQRTSTKKVQRTLPHVVWR